MCACASALLVSESVMVVPSKAEEAPSQADRCLGQLIAEKRLFVRHGLFAFWRNDNRSVRPFRSCRTMTCDDGIYLRENCVARLRRVFQI